MNKIGLVVGFPMKQVGEHGALLVGPGKVRLINGFDISYSDTWTLTGLQPGNHQLFFLDADLDSDSTAKPVIPGADLFRVGVCKMETDTELSLQRGVYAGGVVVLGQVTIGVEPPTKRRERLEKSVEEEKARGNRAYLKTVARKEGISESRLKQIISRRQSQKKS